MCYAFTEMRMVLIDAIASQNREVQREVRVKKTMAKRISGRFYLKKTSNGNLVGEWSNDHDAQVFSESADLIEPDRTGDVYLGHYFSTWQENGESRFATLTIYRRSGRGSLFALEWSGSSNFLGEGMLCDEILIGNYRSK